MVRTIIIAICLIAFTAIHTHALNCAYMAPDGSFFNMGNLTWKTVGVPYTAYDGPWRYSINICDVVSENKCRAGGGYVCMYNASSGDMTNLLATLAPQYEQPEWSVNWVAGVPQVVLTARNGFYVGDTGTLRAVVKLELKCDPTAPPLTKQLSLNPNYQLATFKLGLQTPYACLVGKAAITLSAPVGIPRNVSEFGSIWVTINSSPPKDVTILCSSSYLFTPFFVTFNGPENAQPSSFEVHARFAANGVPATVNSFDIQCSLSGSNASIYTAPSVFTVPIFPYHPNPTSSGGISGGSVFLIILFVGGFVYISLGCLYNWRVSGTEPGWSSFPHIGIWRQIWQYAKDGWAYFFGDLLRIQSCKKVAESGHNYNEINTSRT